ncbi:MAG: thiamine-phosphate kinase [Steroidobacteraceae bacterium]
MPLGEFELIDRWFRRPSRDAPGVVLGIGDDAALLRVPDGHELVAAIDTIVAGRHFLPDAKAHAIGHQALAVNLSDLAAMGAKPAWALLALTLPQVEEAWLGQFARGWFDLADREGVALVGGDTTRGPLTVSVQVLGWVETGTALRRAGARPGDRLVVTGTLGDAAAGLSLARGRVVGAAGSAQAHLRRRFEYPEPRLAFGRLARGVASAAMDLSDGLAGDAPKLAAASAVAAHICLERLPLSAALLEVADAAQAHHWALCGGEDYELLLAVPPAGLARLGDLAAQCGLHLTDIGECRAGEGVTWSMDGRPLGRAPAGFDHFR